MMMETHTTPAAAALPRAPRRFTVLLPVLRPPALMPFAIQSVLAQTEMDFELCIICDGAPAETVAAARRAARHDPRIQVFPFPKGERHGEAWRAAVLDGSRSDHVAQLGDDDLWLPNHLERLAAGLRQRDFVSMPQIRVHRDGQYSVPAFGDLAEPRTRNRMLYNRWNFFGPTEAGYRMDAYRRLVVGWSPAPEDLPSDLFMWRKFLATPGLRYRTATAVTSLKFGAQDWDALPLEDRAAAIGVMADRLRTAAGRREFTSRARKVLASRIGGRRVFRSLTEHPVDGLLLSRALIETRFGGDPGRGRLPRC